MNPPCVAIETPYAGGDAATVAENLAYARAALADSLRRGEAPFASHLLYPQPGVLSEVTERAHGLIAGLAHTCYCDTVAVYTDLGVSAGMQASIDAALARGQAVVYRTVSWSVSPPPEGVDADVYATAWGDLGAWVASAKATMATLEPLIREGWRAALQALGYWSAEHPTPIAIDNAFAGIYHHVAKALNGDAAERTAACTTWTTHAVELFGVSAYVPQACRWRVVGLPKDAVTTYRGRQVTGPAVFAQVRHASRWYTIHVIALPLTPFEDPEQSGAG